MIQRHPILRARNAQGPKRPFFPLSLCLARQGLCPLLQAELRWAPHPSYAPCLQGGVATLSPKGHPPYHFPGCFQAWLASFQGI